MRCPALNRLGIPLDLPTLPEIQNVISFRGDGGKKASEEEDEQSFRGHRAVPRQWLSAWLLVRLSRCRRRYLRRRMRRHEIQSLV